jgi:hypothetical protein
MHEKELVVNQKMISMKPVHHCSVCGAGREVEFIHLKRDLFTQLPSTK